MGKIWVYFTNTYRGATWWRRLVGAVILAPIFYTLYFLTWLVSIIIYLPLLLVYWVKTGDTISHADIEYNINEFFFD